MFDELIIKAVPSLVKFFYLLKLPLYFSKPQIRHLQAFIVAMMLKGFAAIRGAKREPSYISVRARSPNLTELMLHNKLYNSSASERTLNFSFTVALKKRDH